MAKMEDSQEVEKVLVNNPVFDNKSERVTITLAGKTQAVVKFEYFCDKEIRKTFNKMTVDSINKFNTKVKDVAIVELKKSDHLMSELKLADNFIKNVLIFNSLANVYDKLAELAEIFSAKLTFVLNLEGITFKWKHTNEDFLISFPSTIQEGNTLEFWPSVSLQIKEKPQERGNKPKLFTGELVLPAFHPYDCAKLANIVTKDESQLVCKENTNDILKDFFADKFSIFARTLEQRQFLLEMELQALQKKGSDLQVSTIPNITKLPQLHNRYKGPVIFQVVHNWRSVFIYSRYEWSRDLLFFYSSPVLDKFEFKGDPEYEIRCLQGKGTLKDSENFLKMFKKALSIPIDKLQSQITAKFLDYSDKNTVLPTDKNTNFFEDLPQNTFELQSESLFTFKFVLTVSKGPMITIWYDVRNKKGEKIDSKSQTCQLSEQESIVDIATNVFARHLQPQETQEKITKLRNVI